MDDPPTSLVTSKSTPSASAVNQESAMAASFSQDQQQTIHNPETNIFVAAQRGDIALIRQLIESGQASATDRDEQNITPLHWAAINAQVPACRFLLEQGAEVDALGGDLVATPMQWAARNGYLYVIHLLISWGADPDIRDSQGYNTLHLVTHSSSVMPLLYLLHQPINVDSRDSQGHTSLMWAAYQGDALSVDLLLKHGASTLAKDDSGLTPLHWAVVRANRAIIRKLVEHGADLLAKDGEGRTPRDMAVELKSLGAWKRALEEGGMNEYGVKRVKPLSDRNTKLAIFFLPTLFFYIIFQTLSILPWYTSVLLAVAEFFGMHHIVTRVLLNSSTYTESVNTTPYFAGIIFASVVWVLFSWITRLVSGTQSPLINFAFIVSASLCVYNFIRAITLDPGTCPKPASEEELKSVIEELASEGRLNGQMFCLGCLARKPLRSKHCRICDKCVARHDHHCPWVWNCVGSNNHRQFVLFVLMLVIGIGLFDYLSWEYFAALPIFSTPDTPSSPSTSSNATTPNPNISPSCILPTELCLITSSAGDPLLFSVALWSTLQLSWTLVLLASQLWQVARQMTTLEVSNLGRYGFMGGRGGESMRSQGGHSHHSSNLMHSSASSLVNSDLTESTHSSQPHSHSHGSKCICCPPYLLTLLGFDRFTKGKSIDGLARASTAANPFDLGMWGNCKDFWTAGKELGVEYDKLYDVPQEGFLEAKRRRDRENEPVDGKGASSARGWLRMGMGSGPSRRGGYEPLSQV
ncbi:palmitoyltransferase akr1 [Paramarasmius palmivorus]|uniref:Palmitoyltransferase n=1 Tax=Paramarasmius palmivorus TaxID=297713 RepID=A0AAW0CZP3_9AGAR